MTGTLDHIAGETFHGRKGAVQNAFRYGVDYLLLEPEAKLREPPLFSRNRAGLTSLHDVDHGGVPRHGAGAGWARHVLAAHGLSDLTGGRLLLLAQPRVLGHVFNPVSFWLAHDADGGLRAVIAEVSNTFGDRHSYLCHHADGRVIEPGDRMTAAKIFHVSPFQPIGGGYVFRFDIGDDRIGIWIDYTSEEGGLYATLTGWRQPLTAGRIVGMCLRRPFGSRRVLGLIHWQALRLWWKGARYRVRPLPPENDVSG
ncbi:hypothetical protein SAMN04490244_109166 [Tranquillimonas rosea]|uniref:Cyclopropane-fatty-acyl-phospholipid synthase n=1 Tax=Tranquillimonas rosea TaxID=641238 RepID=A0A1H9W7L1_9RHOB|nr:DUF1365 domain-containing protein [Tranquillimonas rosea]SES29804.1 hypothetical protein SAMN04490244_109166 [Tranquillimonas rosea]